MFRRPAFRYLVSLAILALIFYKVGWTHTFGAVDAVRNARYLIYGLIVLVAYLLVRSYRWFLVVKTIYPEVPPRQSALSFFYGLGLGLITPGRLGEVSRTIALPDSDRQFLGGFVIWEKVIDLMVLAAIASLGIGLFFGMLPLAAVLLPLAGLAIFLKRQVRRERTGSSIPVLGNYLGKLRESISYFDGRFLYCQASLSILIQVTLFLVYYFVLNAFEPVEIWTIFLVQPVVTLTNALPVTAGGLGAREAASVLLYGQFHISSTAALSAPLIVYFLGDIIPALIGIVLGTTFLSVRSSICSRTTPQ